LRIVSLLPSATEIVCALGLEDNLVAVTHECDYPQSVQAKPAVTSSRLGPGGSSAEIDRHIRELVHQGSSIYSLDADRLAALQPDLILTQELCEVCAVSYPIVEQAARRNPSAVQLVSLEPESLADVFEHIRLVGRLAARADAAEQVVAGLEGRLAAVAERVADQPIRRVVTLEWLSPPFNCGHWTPQLVEVAGGRDLLGTARKAARAIEWAEVVRARPEVLVISACGVSLERSMAETQAADAEWSSLDAEVWVVDGNAFFSRPGPRLVESVEIMAGLLHPDVVMPPGPGLARRLR
jgi:iron complex transport system substrate-binding protein